MAKIALGDSREATQPDCLKALVIELVATFLFVFAGVGSAMAAGNNSRSVLMKEWMVCDVLVIKEHVLS